MAKVLTVLLKAITVIFSAHDPTGLVVFLLMTFFPFVAFDASGHARQARWSRDHHSLIRSFSDQ